MSCVLMQLSTSLPSSAQMVQTKLRLGASSTRTQSWASNCSRSLPPVADVGEGGHRWDGSAPLPKFAPIPFREDDLWNGYPEETNAPYGLAKKMLLVQAQAYRDEYGTNAICLFPVNLYGPGDNFDVETGHVIPGMIRKFVEAQRARTTASVVLWGDGSPTREFLYVARRRSGLSAWHSSATTARTPSTSDLVRRSPSRDLAERVREAVGFTGAIEWDASRPNGQPRRKLDTSRARERFGFGAETTLDQGLSATVEWYRAHRAIADGS